MPAPTTPVESRRQRRSNKGLRNASVGCLFQLVLLVFASCPGPGAERVAETERCKQCAHKHSTYRAAQHDHANTRGSSRFACIVSPCKIVVIHVSCRTCPCLLPRLHFHLLLLSFHRLHRHPQYIWSTMNILDPMHDHTATISDRVAISRRQPLPQVMSPKSLRPKKVLKQFLKISSPKELSLTGIF